MSCFLGIDAGTSGIQAVIIDSTGKVLAEGYHECDLITLKPGWVEQNPAQWWVACKSAIKQATQKCERSSEIKGIGFTGQMQGTTLMDAENNTIGNCIIWIDQRAHSEADELNGSPNFSEMLDITANCCLPSYWAPKLLWIKKHQPEDFAKIKKVLFTKDYLRFLMTGEIATDVSDASCSFLLDMKKRTWSDRMFELTGIPREIVPERILESAEVAGHLLPDIAEELGLPAGIPIACGSGDQLAGGVGSGVIESGIITSTIGTSGVIFGCCDTPFVDKQRRGIYSLCHGTPDKYSFLGCTLGAGGSFKWLKNTFLQDKQVDSDIYDYMTGLAEKAPVGSEGLVFLPYLNGESTPHVDPDARGVFFGMSYRHDLSGICRSVMEGVVYSLRDTLDILRNFGVEVKEVRALGGGAKSALWRQIQADVFNAPVVTMNMEEGSAAGAAFFGAVASGEFASIKDCCESILKPVSRTEPIPENVEKYNDFYGTYKKLYPALKPLFKEQAALVNTYFSVEEG